MNSLKQLFNARYFPTFTKPLLTGLVTSGIVVALHALGIDNVIPAEVNAAAAPLVGFIAAAITQGPGSNPSVGTVQVQATAAIHTATYKPGETLGKTIAGTFLDDVANVIDGDPALLQSLGAQALERVLHPAVAVPVAADLVKLAEDAVNAPQGAPVPTEVVNTGNH